MSSTLSSIELERIYSDLDGLKCWRAQEAGSSRVFSAALPAHLPDFIHAVLYGKCQANCVLAIDLNLYNRIVSGRMINFFRFVPLIILFPSGRARNAFPGFVPKVGNGGIFEAAISMK